MLCKMMLFFSPSGTGTLGCEFESEGLDFSEIDVSIRWGGRGMWF